MKLLISIAMSMVCSLLCIAQGERNNWFFGDSIGITFNSGNPLLLSNTTARSFETASAISKKNGALIFYGTSYFNTSGISVSQCYNRMNSSMPNSLGINSNASITQGQIIIPNPDDTNTFYLFSLEAKQGIGIVAYSSTIDLTLDSGRGAVVQKNILLCDTPLCEKMTAVKHANGRDWWLLVHSHISSNFFEYLITPSGISGPSVITVGSCIGCNNTYDQGQMVFSKDGSKLCVASVFGILDLYDFDRCSGALTLNQNLGYAPNTTTFYGCSYSANGQLLYASRFDTLWQYDLNASNIKASRLYLMSVDNFEYFISQHLIGPDNKIYIGLGRNNWTTDSLDYYMSVINYPDSVGYACDLRPHSFWLGGHRSKGGLPNEPHYELGALVGSVCDTLTGFTEVNTKVKILVYPNPAFNQLAISSSQLANGQEVTLTIYDMMGKVQLPQKIIPQGDFNVDVKALPSGIYMLQLKQEDRLFNGRFLKE